MKKYPNKFLQIIRQRYEFWREVRKGDEKRAALAALLGGKALLSDFLFQVASALFSLVPAFLCSFFGGVPPFFRAFFGFVPGFLWIFTYLAAKALAFAFSGVLLLELQLFTFVLLFVRFCSASLALAFAAATVSSVACVVAAKTGEASRTADSAIIVFFIISSFNVSVMSVIQHGISEPARL